jgi:hypothetical protein
MRAVELRKVQAVKLNSPTGSVRPEKFDDQEF